MAAVSVKRSIESQNAALRGDENCIELRDRSHLCYKSIINYDLDIANFLVISPQIRYIEVFDLTNKFGRSPATSLNRGSTVIGLCRDLRISCNSWFYFLFDMICMSLNMICISKRAINFYPSISIKANGITSHYGGQPRTVTSSYNYAAPKKDEKANPFWSNYFKV